LAEWQAYSLLEPFGAPAAFWQAALIASTLANVHRTKKTQKAFTPEDFMPRTLVEPTDADLTETGVQALREWGARQRAQAQQGRRTTKGPGER